RNKQTNSGLIKNLFVSDNRTHISQPRVYDNACCPIHSRATCGSVLRSARFRPRGHPFRLAWKRSLFAACGALSADHHIAAMEQAEGGAGRIAWSA
ncbi:MAG: hypothetical protein E6614_07175, partial [Bradyrhizobium sp.]|nr:hypothetical protein [Bradyrhizobium sp.]